MVSKFFKLYPFIIVMVGMMFGAFLAAPLGYTGGAALIVPADDRDLPDGSFISERRMKKIATEVKQFKMKEEAKKQQQEQSLQGELPKPKNAPEK